MATLLLVLVILLTLLLGQAAATIPSMDHPLSPSATGWPYPDPEGMLDAICELCKISVNYCVQNISNQPQRATTITADTFLSHPEWPRDSFLVPDFERDEELLPFYYDRRPPLINDVVGELNENATTIQPSTIQIHVEDTYNPGDRLERAGPRQPPSRRQAPRPGGFPCTHGACEKTFHRSCDLKRHAKTHLAPSERPHKCSFCYEGFLYPKDRLRHERTHDQSSSPQTMLTCDVHGCDNVAGFSRRDNLLRHQRKRHPHLFATS